MLEVFQLRHICSQPQAHEIYMRFEGELKSNIERFCHVLGVYSLTCGILASTDWHERLHPWSIIGNRLSVNCWDNLSGLNWGEKQENCDVVKALPPLTSKAPPYPDAIFRVGDRL